MADPAPRPSRQALASLALGLVLAGSAACQAEPPSSPSRPEGTPLMSETPTEPAATGPQVYPSFDEACAAFDPEAAGAPVPAEDAAADATELGQELVGKGPVLLVGMAKCHGRFVVSIGVSDPRAVLPPSGPRGTPVLAFQQGEISAY